MGRQQQERSITRRELAASLGMHPDSLSRLMPEGLAVAIIRWGGHGREQLFSLERAMRFVRAWRCRQSPGTCSKCWRTLEDCQAVAEHLIDRRHAYGACVECRAAGELCQPCGRF